MKTSRRNAIKLGAAAVAAATIPMTAGASPEVEPEAVRLYKQFVKTHSAHRKALEVWAEAERENSGETEAEARLLKASEVEYAAFTRLADYPSKSLRTVALKLTAISVLYQDNLWEDYLEEAGPAGHLVKVAIKEATQLTGRV